MKKFLTPLFLCLVSLCFVSAAFAIPLVQSNFDTGDEGWRVGDFFSATGSPATPTYISSGGNPGGFIRTSDLFSWNAYLAPVKFLGNQSAAFGGSLDFDTRVLSTDGNAYYAVILEGGGLQVGYNNGIPTTAWTTFSIPLTGAGWFKNLNGSSGTGGDPISAAELQSVLGNLTAFRIEADWQTGGDQVDLDNVRLNSSAVIPVPPTLLLLGSGLLGLGGWRRFRKG
jgi:hypothetical protein